VRHAPRKGKAMHQKRHSMHKVARRTRRGNWRKAEESNPTRVLAESPRFQDESQPTPPAQSMLG